MTGAPTSLNPSDAYAGLNPGVMRSGAACAFVVAGMYLGLHIMSLIHAPLLSSFAGDEFLSYCQAARNFNKYGFFNSTLLQDLSSSSAREEHPYVYNHMGSGPEITMALLTRVVGEHCWAVRLFFALLFLLGLFFFYRFAAVLLGGMGLAGAGYAFLLLDPMSVMQLIDHPGQAAYPLFAFLPWLTLRHAHTTGKSGFYWAALSVVVISTFFITYQLVILNIICTLLLWQLKLFPLTKRDFVGLFLAAGLGVFLHIVQNVWHLSPGVAIQELMITVSNRVTGFPKGHDLVVFYQQINVVHNGVHSIRPLDLLEAYLQCVNLRVLKSMALLGLVLLAFQWSTHSMSTAAASFTGNAARMICWGLTSILVAVLAFPAYSADYNLQGNGHFFGALLGLACFLLAQRTVAGSMAGRFVKTLLNCLIALIALLFLIRQFSAAVEVYQIAQTNKYAFLEQIEKHALHRVTMSNLYPPLVGFFTREKVYGVAEMDAFPEDGPPNPDAAYCKMIANLKTAGDCRPSHYIHSRALLPGFGESLNPTYNELLRKHIARRHRIVYEDAQITIFELNWQ